MNRVEPITRELAGAEATWAGLAAGGWLVALLVSVVAVCQAARADRLCGRAAETAHELRGPLCAARLALDSLERVLADAPRLAAGIASVDLELRRAGLALEDLGRLGAGGVAGARSVSCSSGGRVDLDALAAAAEPAWRALPAARGTTLQLRKEGGRARVTGDPRRLHQGIGNLVANAFEHGCGPVRVTIVGDGPAARVEVADGGSGPSTQSIERACRRARRSWGAGGQASQRGHGLAVAARVARESGGRLHVRATPHGAVVTLELSADRPSGVTLWQRLARTRRRDQLAVVDAATNRAAGLRSPLPRAR